MQHCYGAKALSLDPDCTTCGPMFVIHAWGRIAWISELASLRLDVYI